MHVLQKIGNTLAIALLPVFLFSFGFSFSLYQVIGSPDSIKSALTESGAYETIVNNTLDSMRDEGEESDDLPTQDPVVRDIFEQALSPGFLKTQAEGFLDDTYAWLRGDQQNLQFVIDLSSVKTRLVDGLAGYADQRLQELPRCTSVQDIREFETLDVFTAECVPPTNRSEAVAQVRQEVAGLELFDDVSITADDIKNDQGQTLEEQLQGVRDAYGSFKTGIYITGVVSLLLIAGVVLLSQNWRTGARRAAVIAITVGGISALLAWGGAFAFERLSANIVSDNKGEVVATLANTANHLVVDLRNWWLGYGLFLAFLGIAALVTLIVIKKRQKPPENNQTKDTAGRLSS